MKARRRVQPKSLRAAAAAIRATQPDKVRAALERLPKLDAFCVAGSEWTGDYFFLRLLFSRFRENKIAVKQVIALTNLLADFGSSDEMVAAAFEKAVIDYHPRSVMHRELELAQWFHSRSQTTAAIAQAWASNTLAGMLQYEVWSKWQHWNDEDEFPPSPANVRALVRLGASPDSFPPPWHREQNPAGFYAIELGNPQISSLLFTPRVGGRKHWRATRDAGGTRGRARSATRLERDRVVEALRLSGLDPLTGELDKRPAARHRLDRLISLMGSRYLPDLQRISFGNIDRKRSMLGGHPFTSKRFPWPGPARAPYAPLVQLDLAELSAATGLRIGRNFLQLWCPIDMGMVGTGVVSLPVRVIPRATVTRTTHLTPPPPIIIESRNDPNYSWKQSLVVTPRYITGWRKNGFALPDLTEFAISSELSSLSVRPQRPALGVAACECPALNGHFFKLPLKWRPLVTIYGPLHGVAFKKQLEIADRAEIYVSHSQSGRVSFKAAWIRTDG